MLDASTLLNIGAMLVGIGSVYGLIRADLKTLHEKHLELRDEQRDTNKTLFNKYDVLDRRMNEHVEHHHLRQQP